MRAVSRWASSRHSVWALDPGKGLTLSVLTCPLGNPVAHQPEACGSRNGLPGTQLGCQRHNWILHGDHLGARCRGRQAAPSPQHATFISIERCLDGRPAVLLFEPQVIHTNSPPGHGAPAHRLWASEQPRTQKAQKWVQGAEPVLQKGRHHSLVHSRLAQGG